MTRPEAFERAFIAVTAVVGGDLGIAASTLDELTVSAHALCERLSPSKTSHARAAALAVELGHLARQLDRWRAL